MNPNTREFKGVLAIQMADFLHHQRALGKRFLGEERGLRLFDQWGYAHHACYIIGPRRL